MNCKKVFQYCIFSNFYSKSGLLILLVILIFTGCRKDHNQIPVANFIVFPEEGNSLSSFLFDASSSSDSEGDQWRLLKRWDFDDDGIWDTEPSIVPKFSYRFKKNGTYPVSLLITDSEGVSDSVTKNVIVRDIIKDSVFIDQRDSKSYKTVFLNDRWWMAENLKFGNSITSTDQPSDNKYTEYYTYKGAYPSEEPETAYYTWNEITNYGGDTINGICPPGWRIPGIDDFKWIINHYWVSDNRGQYLSPEGKWGANMTMNGMFVYTVNHWIGVGSWSEWWINPASVDNITHEFYTFRVNRDYIMDFAFTGNRDIPFAFYWWKPAWGRLLYDKVAIPLRCIKYEE